jgi:hypothetical protein
MAKELTGRELASLGGKARAKAMTKKERKAIASGAAKARWAAVAAKKAKESGNG